MSKKISIVSSGFLGPNLEKNVAKNLEAGFVPKDIPDTLLGDDLPSDFRRIGRYIRHVVAGAKCCFDEVDEKTKGQRAGVFLASGFCNMEEGRTFYQSLYSKDRGAFSPTMFANSVGNSASFYLSRALGVVGESYAITQEEISFEAALYNATLLLELGDIDYAIVGGTDGYVESESYLRERIDVEDTIRGKPTRCGEGSSWVLLKYDETKGPIVRNVEVLRSSEGEAEKNIIDLVGNALSAAKKSKQISFGYRVSQKEKDSVLEKYPDLKNIPYLENCGVFSTASAFGLCSYLKSSHMICDSSFIHVQKTIDEQLALMVVDS